MRTPREGREVARADLRAALGLLHARHVAGDPGLTAELRLGVLGDWRAAAGTRLAELQVLHVQRTQRSGELAFLLEPDLRGQGRPARRQRDPRGRGRVGGPRAGAARPRRA